MASIGPDAGSVKYQAALDRHLPQEHIAQLARKCGHRWRQRTLGPAVTVHLWIMQVLLFNLSMAGVRHLSRKAVTAAAICQAKARLPMKLLVRLNRFLLEQVTGGKGQSPGMVIGCWGAMVFVITHPTRLDCERSSDLKSGLVSHCSRR
jgi:hypothetical protein